MIAVLLFQLVSALPALPPGHCVIDEARVLTMDEVRTLEDGCRGGRGFIYTAVMATTRGQGDQFGISLFNYWGVGSDSALVMVSPRDRKWRIVVGSSLRSSISDAAASDIGRAYGVPAFRAGAWGTGLISIEHALLPKMQARPAIPAPIPALPPVTRRTTTTTTTAVTRRVATPIISTPVVVHHDSSIGLWLLLVFGLIFLAFLFVWWLMKKDDDREAQRAHERDMERIRRAPPPERAKKWEEDIPPVSPRVVSAPSYPSSSYPRTAPAPAAAPVNINVQQSVSAPAVVPIPVPITSGYAPRRYPYIAPTPVIVVDDPILPIPVREVVEERITTTTTVEETSGGLPQSVLDDASWGVGGAGGSIDDTPGGGGGGIDDTPSFDPGPSGDTGGDGGDF